MTTPPRVLYVDRDGAEPSVRRRLETQGFAVRSQPGVADALAELAWADCVLAAYDLTDATGVEFLRRVRERAPDLPFVLYPDAGSEAVASEAIAAGVTDYVPRGEGVDIAARLEAVLADTGGPSADAPLRRLHDAMRDLMAETGPAGIAERTAEAARAVLDAPGAAVYLTSGSCPEPADGPGGDRAEPEPVAVTGDVATLEVAAGPDGATAAVEDRVVEPFDDCGSAAEPAGVPGGPGGDGRPCVPLGEHGTLVVSAADGGLDATDRRLATLLAATAEAALDRAANETALRRERDDLAALFENIPDPTLETTMQDGEPIVERVNPAFEDVFGYDGEAIRGENVDEYIVPEDLSDRADRHNDRVQSGEGFHGEVRRRTADGLRDFILHVVPHDVGETETRGYAIYTDITDQKVRQRELERQNQRIEALHDVATRMKTAPDSETIYGIAIDAAEQILEFDLSLIDEIDGDRLVPTAISSGIDLSDYYEETPIDRENNLGAETARTGETMVIDDLRETRYAPANFEYRSALSIKVGDWGIFQAVSTEEAAFSDADRKLAELLIEHAVAALDRNAREHELEARADALARQNERLDRFASVVSHDLRNPLSVARGRLDLARSTGDEDHYRAVERAHERIDELVNGLLTLAKRGELKQEPIAVDLENAAREAWRTVDTEALSLQVRDAPTVQADPERLRQLLENLFTNAVEHADGATAITVGGLEDDAGFYVADDGVGVPTDERDAVRESGHSGAADGTGLGLAIVDTIAEAHDWRLTITDSDDGGACFEFLTAGDAADEA